MALIHQTTRGSGISLKKQAGLLGVIALTFMGMMALGSGNLRADSFPIVLTSLAMVLFFSLVAMKKNPLIWLKLFRRAEFERANARNQQFRETLGALGDDCHVFQGIVLEFFRIDFLIVSPHGIFVIKPLDRTAGDRVTKGGPDVDYSDLLDKDASRLWRLCHMINMLIKKGYKANIMPAPVLVDMDGSAGLPREYRGIVILGQDTVVRHIEASGMQMAPEMAQGFAGFINARYAS